MTGTETVLPDTAELQDAIEAKTAEIAGQDRSLTEARGRLREAQVAGGATRPIRDEIRAIEEAVEDLAARRAHLERQLAAARERDQYRAGFVLLAELYGDDVEYLKSQAEVHRCVAALEAARAAVPPHYGSERRRRVRRVVGVWLGCAPGMASEGPFVGDDGGAKVIKNLGGVLNNGGDTLDDVLADIRRFERFAAEAAGEAEGPGSIRGA